MEVVKYKKSGINCYDVYLDNNTNYKLYEDIILKYDLLIEKKIDEKKLKDILNENELYDAYYLSLKYIGKKMRTKLEVKKYLKSKEFNDKSIAFALNKLEQNGYINENRYIEAYIIDAMNLSMFGPNKIMNNLCKLGVNLSKVENNLAKIKDNIWKERIETLIDKRYKFNKNSEIIFKNKMYSYLIGAGYDSEMINKILGEYEFDTSSNFEREANKVWNLLIKKFDKKDAMLKFKVKMYSKGYKVEEIGKFLDKVK